MSSAAVAAEADHSAVAEVEGLGVVTVGVTRALGAKCQRCGSVLGLSGSQALTGHVTQGDGHRCWNYSPLVGAAGDHPQLCERCVPVIRNMNFALPAAPAAAVAV